jgi:hypothetical protein
MKKIIILISLLYPCLLNAQKNADFGVFGGTSYYMGDINNYMPFYKASWALGALYRYNINTRYAIKGTVRYGNIAGNDADFKNEFNKVLRDGSFSATILNVAVKVEFNFLDYVNMGRKRGYSTYITSGIGYGIMMKHAITTPNIMGSDALPGNHFNIPMGVGFKYNIKERFTSGIEWTYVKAFSDKIDGITNYHTAAYKSNMHNMDWYSFAGVFLTFKIFDPKDDCPVYWTD